MSAISRSLFFVFLLLALALPLSYAGLKWPVFHASGSIVGKPAIGSNFVYVLASDGSVDVLDFTTGSQTFPSSLGGPASIGPVTGTQAVVFANDAGQMDALELQTGKRLWRFPALKPAGGVSSSTGASAPSSSNNAANLLPPNATLRGLAAGGHLIYAVFSNQTIAFNESTGGIRWIRPLSDGGGPAGADEGQAYISDGPNLKAYSHDGQLLWSAPIGPLFKSQPAPDMENGRVYVATTKGYVLALNRESGDTLWAYPLNGWGMSTPTLAGDEIIFGTNDGHVHALEAATGLSRWSTDVGGAIWSQPAILQNGARRIALISSNDNSILALDTTTGALLWRYRTTDWMGSPSVARDGRTVVAGSRDGSVWALAASPMCTVDYPSDLDLVGTHLELRARAWAWEGVSRARLFIGGALLPDIPLNDSGPFNVSLDLSSSPDGYLPIQCLADDPSGLSETDAGRPKVSPIKSANAPLSVMSLTVPTQAEPGQVLRVYVRNPDGFDLSDVTLEFAGSSKTGASPFDLPAPLSDGNYLLTIRRAGFKDVTQTISVRANLGPIIFGGLLLLVLLALAAYFLLRKKTVKAPADYKL